MSTFSSWFSLQKAFTSNSTAHFCQTKTSDQPTNLLIWENSSVFFLNHTDYQAEVQHHVINIWCVWIFTESSVFQWWWGGQNRIYRFPLNSILPLCLWSSTKIKVKLKVFWNFYMIERDQSQVSLHTPQGVINLGQIFLGNQLLNISHLHNH